MAASPNPLQGSLFKSNDRSSGVDANATKSSNPSSEKLTNKRLKEDAERRPRSKKTQKKPHQINNLAFLHPFDYCNKL